MTLASSIITDAMRESNLIALVATPTANEQAEGLRHLTNLLLSTLGNEAGGELTDIQIGGSFDQSIYCSPYVPANARLVVESGTAATLHPRPYDGQRFAITGDFAAVDFVINANGRKIEDAATLTLDADGTSTQWMYRADTANWVKITALLASDTFPLPREFDDYFIVGLALRLNPRHRQALAEESVAALSRSRNQIRARYRRRRLPSDPGPLGLLGQTGGGSTAFNPLSA